VVSLPPPARPWRRRLLRVGTAIAVLLLVLCLLLVSCEPSVAVRPTPTAQTVAAGYEAAKQLDDLRDSGGSPASVRFDNRALRGVSDLASDAIGVERLEAQVRDGTFTAAASLPLPIGGWINAAVATSGSNRGFPPLRFSMGRLNLPAWAGRPIAELGRTILRWRGASLPPLDEMVRGLAVEREALVAEVRLPGGSGVVQGVIGFRGVEVDRTAVRRVYCRLAAEQRAVPDRRLTTQVRRAFANIPEQDAAEHNRAAFVALAMFTVNPRAGDLAGAVRVTRACRSPVEPFLLAGRNDLAKHWALAAALGAVLGADVASSMGEWKELSDSLPRGSGFSFVDLAATRSGLQMARLAVEPSSAAKVARRLAAATDEQLLPIGLLAAREGISEQQFLARYGTIDSRNYATTIAWIDRELGQVTRP